MPASVKRRKSTTTYQGYKAYLFSFCYWRRVSRGCLTAAAGAICEAPPQVMIVRPWCMEACRLAFFPFCMVPSCSLSVVCVRHPLCTYPIHPSCHPHSLDLPSRSAAAAVAAAVSRRQPVKPRSRIIKTHGVLRLSRSSSVCVCHDVRSSVSRPVQARPSNRRRDDNCHDQMTMKKGASVHEFVVSHV